MELLTLILFVILYFIPGIIASIRGHHDAAAIWVTNFLLGWVIIGWIVALIWSVKQVRREQ